LQTPLPLRSSTVPQNTDALTLAACGIAGSNHSSLQILSPAAFAGGFFEGNQQEYMQCFASLSPPDLSSPTARQRHSESLADTGRGRQQSEHWRRIVETVRWLHCGQLSSASEQADPISGNVCRGFLWHNQTGVHAMSDHTEDISNAVACCRQLIQQEELQAWCAEHAGEAMADIVNECPPCDGWYPKVDINGDLTGEIAHAQDEDYQMFRDDDRTQCVVHR
jgi:hypothetical protein